MSNSDNKSNNQPIKLLNFKTIKSTKSINQHDVSTQFIAENSLAKTKLLSYNDQRKGDQLRTKNQSIVDKIYNLNDDYDISDEDNDDLTEFQHQSSIYQHLSQQQLPFRCGSLYEANHEEQFFLLTTLSLTLPHYSEHFFKQNLKHSKKYLIYDDNDDRLIGLFVLNSINRLDFLPIYKSVNGFLGIRASLSRLAVLGFHYNPIALSNYYPISLDQMIMPKNKLINLVLFDSIPQ